MTRSSKLALVTLLAALLSIATVGASAPCTGYAQERCEQMAAAHDTALFRIAEVASPVRLFPANGVGQEHFEAMESERLGLPGATLAAPGIVGSFIPRYAQEHYEQITAAPFAASTFAPQHGQEHYEQIMAAQGTSN
jgi:hypothetical protein